MPEHSEETDKSGLDNKCRGSLEAKLNFQTIKNSKGKL